LATDTQIVDLHKASVLSEDSISKIEKEIDRLDAALPPLSSFILPGGSQSGSLAHVCRTITRRAERRLFDLNSEHTIDNQIFIYINRLSDYFFILSRHLTLTSGSKEICWKK
jgi:cob(I)alamin adenosyltransferase